MPSSPTSTATSTAPAVASTVTTAEAAAQHDTLCTFCEDAPVVYRLGPCGHRLSCATCWEKFCRRNRFKCPLCCHPIREFVHEATGGIVSLYEVCTRLGVSLQSAEADADSPELQASSNDGQDEDEDEEDEDEDEDVDEEEDKEEHVGTVVLSARDDHLVADPDEIIPPPNEDEMRQLLELEQYEREMDEDWVPPEGSGCCQSEQSQRGERSGIHHDEDDNANDNDSGSETGSGSGSGSDSDSDSDSDNSCQEVEESPEEIALRLQEAIEMGAMVEE